MWKIIFLFCVKVNDREVYFVDDEPIKTQITVFPDYLFCHLNLIPSTANLKQKMQSWLNWFYLSSFIDEK